MTYEGKEVLEENTVKGFFNKNQCWAETDVRAPTEKRSVHFDRRNGWWGTVMSETRAHPECPVNYSSADPRPSAPPPGDLPDFTKGVSSQRAGFPGTEGK